MDAIIKVRDVTFAYGDDVVVDGVSFGILPGEFISVIGPNGAGKSTLLRLLYGYLSPSKGTIHLYNTPMNQLRKRDVARKIAVVSPMPRFHFTVSALQLVLMGRSPHMGILAFEGKEDFEIAGEAMTLTKVQDFKNRDVFSLSGGEFQRVLIARALAQQPQIMLLDEPTSYLDIKHQMNICQLLKRMNEQKRITIISVFHDINLAAHFSDRIIVMKEGRIFRYGTPEDVVTGETLESVYGCPVFVDESPLTGRPRVTLAGA
jgi:iron complex transport system ATP-binding protein